MFAACWWKYYSQKLGVKMYWNFYFYRLTTGQQDNVTIWLLLPLDKLSTMLCNTCISDSKKQSPRKFLHEKTIFPKHFTIFCRKMPLPEPLFFSGDAEEISQRKCFPVSFTRFLRIAFCKDRLVNNTFGRLLQLFQQIPGR